MKKKLILILSMLALMVCVLAVSVSASEYQFVPNSEVYIPFDANFDVITITYTLNDIDYTLCCFSIMDSQVDGVYYIQPNMFKAWCDTIVGLDNLTYTQFASFFNDNYNNINETHSIISYFCAGANGFDESYFNKLYYYEEITQDDLTEQYDKGVIAGVEQGKAEGVSEYKESEEYTNALNAQYTKGVKAGELIGYDDGYADGFSDGQAEEDGAEESALDITKIFPSMILVSLITISVLVYFAVRKKKAR